MNNKAQIELEIERANRALFSANYAYGAAYALEVRLTDRSIASEVYNDSESQKQEIGALIADAQKTQRDALKAAKEAFLNYSDAVIALAKLESLAS